MGMKFVVADGNWIGGPNDNQPSDAEAPLWVEVIQRVLLVPLLRSRSYLSYFAVPRPCCPTFEG